MKAIVKNSGKDVNVEQKLIDIDGMTSYFVYQNTETKEIYKYNELSFKK